MKYLFSLLFSLSFTLLYAQHKKTELTKEIDLYACHIDSTQLKYKSVILAFDSIEIKVHSYKEKIATYNYFINSKTNLTVNYYFKDEKLIFAKVIEQSPLFKDTYKSSAFYFQDDKIVNEDYFYALRPCILIPTNLDFTKAYSYNETFNDVDFLKRYILVLLDKIKIKLKNTSQL